MPVKLQAHWTTHISFRVAGAVLSHVECVLGGLDIQSGIANDFPTIECIGYGRGYRLVSRGLLTHIKTVTIFNLKYLLRNKMKLYSYLAEEKVKEYNYVALK